MRFYTNSSVFFYTKNHLKSRAKCDKIYELMFPFVGIYYPEVSPTRRNSEPRVKRKVEAMKLSTKLLALVMALLMLSTAMMLTSCDNGSTPAGDDTTTAAPADTTTAPTADTTTTVIEDDTPKDLVMMANGESFMRVVRDEDAAAGSVQVNCASDIRQAIEDATSVAPKIDTDWVKRGEDYNHDSLEILVGLTGYSESIDTLAQISYGDYLVKVVGNKLVIAAYSDSALYEACRQVKKLIKENSSEGNLVIPADTHFEGVTDAMLNTLPTYENGTFSSTYVCGGDATLLLVNDTTMDAYSAYLTKLESAGWTKYTTNEVDGNSFATYTNDKYTLNLGYYDYEKASRIIIEPLAKPVGLKEDNVYEKRTTTQLTMLGLEYKKSDGSYYSNGLSMLIRLCDGRFIVIDGGGNTTQHTNVLLNALKEQSKDYLKSGEKITIAAWIITHAHGDHSGMIGKQYGKFTGMKVERFLVNFISDTERTKAMNSSQYSGNWSNGEGGGWTQVITAANALKADVQYVHVGQVLYYADVKIDVLYTIESFAPKLCNAFNTTSITMKMTFDAGDTFLMTGDTTGNGMQIAAKMFPNYIKCDMLQVCHHGYTTWGNDSGMIFAYKTISPPVVLWPQGTTAYPKYKTKSYNVVLFSPELGGQNKNFKEIYVAGSEGDQTIVPIPYTIGTATEIRK